MSDFNYVSNYNVNFEYEPRISVVSFQSGIISSNYKITPKNGTSFDSRTDNLKLSEKSSSTNEFVMKVETTSKKSSEEIAAWFKREADSAPAISDQSGDWPKELRFALKPTIVIKSFLDQVEYSFNWEGLVLGINTNGSKNQWWLSSKFIRSKRELEIIGIKIFDDIYQEIPLEKTEDDDGKKKTDYLRAHLMASVDGTHTFRVKCTLNREELKDWYSKL